MTIKQKRDMAARLVPFASVQGVEKAKPEKVDRSAVVVRPRERRERWAPR